MSEMTIAAVSEMSGLSIYALRYYEQAGLIPSVRRAANGHREYTELDLAWVQFVMRLRETGMPVAQIQEYTRLAKAGEATVPERLALLEAHRDRVRQRIGQLTQYLTVIEGKIEGYRREFMPGGAHADRDCWPDPKE